MDERTSRDDLVQQYLEDSIPKVRRAEIEHLAGTPGTGARRRKANFHPPRTNVFSPESTGAEPPRYSRESQPKGE